MTPLKRFKKLIEVDKKDIYQILLYAILGGIISLSLPLGIQSIVNFIQAGKVSTSWIILVIMVVIGVGICWSIENYAISNYRKSTTKNICAIILRICI